MAGTITFSEVEVSPLLLFYEKKTTIKSSDRNHFMSMSCTRCYMRHQSCWERVTIIYSHWCSQWLAMRAATRFQDFLPDICRSISRPAPHSSSPFQCAAAGGAVPWHALPEALHRPGTAPQSLPAGPAAWRRAGAAHSHRPAAPASHQTQ